MSTNYESCSLKALWIWKYIKKSLKMPVTVTLNVMVFSLFDIQPMYKFSRLLVKEHLSYRSTKKEWKDGRLDGVITLRHPNCQCGTLILFSENLLTFVNAVLTWDLPKFKSLLLRWPVWTCNYRYSCLQMSVFFFLFLYVKKHTLL